MLHTFTVYGAIACDENCNELPLKHLAVFFCVVICYILRGFLAEWILCLWFLPEVLWRRNGPVSEKTVEIECQKMFTNSEKFAMKMTTSFQIPVFSNHQQCVFAHVLLQLFAPNLIGRKRTNGNQEATFTVGSPRGRQPMPGSHIS